MATADFFLLFISSNHSKDSLYSVSDGEMHLSNQNTSFEIVYKDNQEVKSIAAYISHLLDMILIFSTLVITYY